MTRRLAVLAALWLAGGSVNLFGPVGARAAVVLVTSPAALGTNDSIDWGQLGGDFMNVASPSAVTSLHGLSATASTDDPGGLFRIDQGTWLGNFSPGDHLLNTGSAYHPITISFASAVRGAGANIQLDDYVAFTATIEAFSGSTSLGVFSLAGNSTNAADGSAIFIGVLDTSAEITKVVFGLQNPPDPADDIVINALRLNTVSAVPEPSTLAGALAGIAGAAALLRRRRPRP